jgi:D-alanyl-lipoteichoic acid acyltransferase DltB (MBOAT superfamily)
MVMVIYFAIPYRFRWVLLLAASFYFYMATKPGFIIFILLSTFVTYYAGIQIGKAESKSKRKTFLLLSLFFNLGLLFFVKYYNFLNYSLGLLFAKLEIVFRFPALDLLLPVGISFYTFKSLSYAIDVYRGTKTPERHLGFYALYVAFFPQLLAGPIERATSFLPQLYERFDFDYQRVTKGLRLMLWGFFQKMVIADNLAVLVDSIYKDPADHQGLPLLLATFFFAFQIYCDFSGYSDIAIGAAQVMGYQTMENFRRPYFSKSIAEFWRRWHISLSSWFRDYLYIPMGGNRVSVPRWYLNLFVVMLICGFWHGANYTFLVWGGLHGFYLIFSILTRSLRDHLVRMIGLDRVPKLHGYLKILITFSLVCFAWIFFRADTISNAFNIISHLFSGWGRAFTVETLEKIAFRGPLKFELVISLISIGILLSVQVMEERGNLIDRFSEMPIWIRWPVYYSFLLAILLFGNFGAKEFIYFQF